MGVLVLNLCAQDGAIDLDWIPRDAAGHEIQRVNPITGAHSTLVSGGNLVEPRGIAIDLDGRIVSTQSDGTLVRIDPVTKSQAVIASGIPSPLGVRVSRISVPSGPPSGEIAYSENFEGAVGSGWSSAKVSTTPVGGRKFLGDFGNETVTLSLANLAPHSAARISLDLFVIRTWDGNFANNGPDTWRLWADGTSLLSTTFNNHGWFSPSIAQAGQSFPGSYSGPSGSPAFPPMTGAAERETLGYGVVGQPGFRDAVYHLEQEFSHAAETLRLDFSALGLEVLANESWGLDNVQVTLLSGPAAAAVSLQPRSQKVASTYPVALVSAASGALPLFYRWQKDGIDLPGATNAAWATFSASPNDAGVYRVVVSNAWGSATSSNATLSVDPAYTFTTIAGKAQVPGSLNGLGTAARFDHPVGVALDLAGNLYIGDYYNHAIRKIARDGMVSTFAGTPGSAGHADGPAGNAKFWYPAQVASDSEGNLYVAEFRNQTVRKISPDQVVTTLAGSPGIADSNEGKGAAARFNGPLGVTVNNSGIVYVADWGSHTIRKISSDGVVTTLAGLAGSPGAVDGAGAIARFRNPHGLAVDQSGMIYVTDFGNHTLRRISPDGMVTTLAGTAALSGTLDGVGGGARFSNPSEVTVDLAGNLFVTDNANHTVRRITPDAVVTTIAGLPGSPGAADGSGSAARFFNPNGIAVDSSGALYLSEFNGFTIRKGIVSQGPGGQETNLVQAIYSNSFEGIVGAEWSGRKVSITPKGARRFLGNFGNEAVRLTLADLPLHTAVEVSFDLYIIQSWDGNNPYFGPDVWNLGVVGGPTLLRSTFAHALADNYIYPDGQAYPDSFPGGRFRPFTGAVEVDTLGYTFGNLGPMNSVYRHSLGFAHSDSGLKLQFSASGLQALSDESWGLDNVRVQVVDAPAGLLRFSSPYFGAAEDGTNAVITVDRIGGSLGAVSARISVTDGTARAGFDYLAAGGIVSFAQGETQQVLRIPLIDDGVPEADKEFAVSLSEPAGGVLLGTQSRTAVLLEDDDSAIQFVSAGFAGPESDANVRVTAARTGYTNSIAVARGRTKAATGPDAATQNVDFDSTEARVVFQPGEISKSVIITLHDDALMEPDETLAAGLSSPFGARLGTRQETSVLILDNDSPTGPGLGANWQVQDLLVQPDGKILLGGGFNSVNATTRTSIARLNPDASLDNSFNSGNIVINSAVESMALQPDGKIVIGGSFSTINGVSRNRIARLHANGVLDPSFNPDTGANNTVFKVLVQPDGKILLAGAFTTVRGAARNSVARLNANGTLDTAFNPGTGANNWIWGMGLQPDGKIILSGAFGTFNGAARLRFVRLNADGSVDNTFNVGSGGNARANEIIVLPDGKILLGGLFTTYNGTTRNRVMRLNPNGAIDNTFNAGAGPNSTVWSMALQPDGKIIVGGEWTSWNGLYRAGIVRLNPNGSLDSTFAVGTGANAYVGAVGVLADGRVALAGNFKLIDGHHRERFAILGADGDLPLDEVRWTPWPAAAGGNGHFYALTGRPETWSEAEAEAVARGGHLASVDDWSEQVFLQEAFLKGLDRLRPAWIGFHDDAAEGNFVWSGGDPASFLNWAAGEPNNAGANGEDFTVLNWHFSREQGADPSKLGQWNDVPNAPAPNFAQSDGPYYGIIEIAAPSLRLSPPSLDSGGGVSLQIAAATGARVIVEASPDLQAWQIVSDRTTATSAFTVTDPAAAGAKARFYRARCFLP